MYLTTPSEWTGYGGRWHASFFYFFRFEQAFVYHLLLHLRCDKIDPDYIPEHGKGAVVTPATGRRSHQKSRRPKP